MCQDQPGSTDKEARDRIQKFSIRGGIHVEGSLIGWSSWPGSSLISWSHGWINTAGWCLPRSSLFIYWCPPHPIRPACNVSSCLQIFIELFKSMFVAIFCPDHRNNVATLKRSKFQQKPCLVVCAGHQATRVFTKLAFAHKHCCWVGPTM